MTTYMNALTLPEFLVSTFAGIVGGWLWTESVLVSPLRRLIARWFPEEIQTQQSWRGWVAYGTNCPICVGFWLQLAMIGHSVGWSFWAVPITLTAVFIHLVWLQVVLTLTAIQLR